MLLLQQREYVLNVQQMTGEPFQMEKGGHCKTVSCGLCSCFKYSDSLQELCSPHTCMQCVELMEMLVRLWSYDDGWALSWPSLHSVSRDKSVIFFFYSNNTILFT